MTKIPYEKPFLSFEQQSKKLACLLTNSNTSDIKSVLKNVNYYRIGLYVYPFRMSSTKDTLAKNTEFSHILDLYKFDKKLSLVILDGLQTLETAMKTQIAYILGTVDPFFFYHTENNDYILPNKRDLWKSNCKNILNKLDTHATIKKNYKKYKCLPTWIIIETLTMGQQGNILDCLQPAQKAKIIRNMGITVGGVNAFCDFWKPLNQLRNKCAHYDLVWNNTFSNISSISYLDKIPKIRALDKTDSFENTLYSRLIIIWAWLQFIHPTSHWNMRLKKVIHTFPKKLPNNISIEKMGFTHKWYDSDFWNL